MERVLGSLPVDYEFVEAVDASDLTDEYIREVYDDAACRRNIRRSLSKPEIACALSHIKVWEIIKESGLEEAFIMEDDIYIKDEEAFREVLKARNRYPKKWELILFGHGNSMVSGIGATTSFFHKEKIYKKYCISRFINFGCGTLGYLLNELAIDKLLCCTNVLEIYIDSYTGTSRFVNLYGVEPVLIEEDDIGGLSTLQDGRDDYLLVSSTPRFKPFLTKIYIWQILSFGRTLIKSLQLKKYK